MSHIQQIDLNYEHKKDDEVHHIDLEFTLGSFYEMEVGLEYDGLFQVQGMKVITIIDYPHILY